MNVLLFEGPWLDTRTHHYSVYKWYGSYPNPALAVVGGNLRKHGIPFSIVDAKVEDLGIEESYQRVKDIKPDIVGLSAFTTDIYYANEIAGHIKEMLPNTKIVVGGPHITALPEETLERYQNFDIGVVDEGEKVFVELVNNLEAGSLKTTPNIVYREGSRVIKTTFNQDFKVKSLDEIALPCWDLLPPGEMYYVQTTRGCPFPCEFCFRLSGKKVCAKSPENVVKEIEMILAVAEPREFFFSDSTFGMNKRVTMPVLQALIDSGLNKRIKWRTNTRVSVCTDEMMMKMKEAGCISIFFGVESGNLEIAKTAKQNIDIERMNKLLRLAKRLNIETMGGFIFGHPNETKKTLWDTIELAVRSQFHMIVIGIMVLWPGTKVFNLARSGAGGYKLLTDDYRRFDKHFGNCLKFTNFSSQSYLRRMRLLTYLMFYIRNMKFLLLFKQLLTNFKLLFRFGYYSMMGDKIHAETE